ncbi:hypothetical protein [Thermomonas paludicola]|uniref:hypothetical protein n=1 Tax=Thermomonas paludicola TaxID=2884874 RepID=UPI00211511CB|nr:hypothetical protein [Thermomonas paludicola]
MFRRFLPALLLTPAVACATPMRSHDLVQLGIIDRDAAQVLTEYDCRGTRWVAGIPGHRYAVRLTNSSGQRVLVVLSVDGVNAVSGQTAAPSQAGYVLGPWETADIAGWRKSLDDIAQFVFTDLPDSYAARTGRADNVGVVGIAVFREKQVAPVHAPPPVAPGAPRGQWMGKAAAPASADRAMAAEAMPQRIGTGHGQREWAPVGQTGFDRASSRPDQIRQLRYDDVAALAQLGVLPQPPRPLAGSSPHPQAFPGGFVPDPPRW